MIGLLLAATLVCGEDQTTADTPPSVSYGPFPLPLKRTYVFSALGTPTPKADKSEFWAPKDFPPSLAIWLQDVRKFPSGKGRYYFPSRNVLRIYRISAANTAPYETIQPQIKSLRKLLSERPTTVAEDSLPDYPPRNASHSFQEKLCYMDATWGSALCYVTQFTQDGGTPANNEELRYLVQGLSKDDQFYISADFSITNPKLPNRIKDTPKRQKGDYAPDRALLSRQPEGSFMPALDKIRAWLSTLELK
ncbi:MAG: hypothetical protein ACREIF_19590 [Chthoniobacterales bacterium]